jgi:chloride channel protein, CIC family
MRSNDTSKRAIGDFTTSPRVISVSLRAVVSGFVAAFVASGLRTLIDLCTNLFFVQRVRIEVQRVRIELLSPAGHHLGPFVVLVPIAGALIVGVMARYGSERIRGHGIREAIEAILELS